MSGGTCGLSVAGCVCGEPAGHVEQGQPVHVCADRVRCGGEWRFDGAGEFVAVVLPGLKVRVDPELRDE